MEMVLSNGFCEVVQDEMLDIEGGILAEILIVTGLGLLGMGTVAGTTALVVGIKTDLENCYNNAYNSVMNSVSGGDAR